MVYALEAYCLHLGANMGVGGQVKNSNCIMCPFHGWLYNGSTGQCVDHDGKPLPLKSCEYNAEIAQPNGKIDWKQFEAEIPTLRKFPISELNGYIYVWIHAMKEHQE